MYTPASATRGGIGINNIVAISVRILFILLALWIEGVGFWEIMWIIIEPIWSMAEMMSRTSLTRMSLHQRASFNAPTPHSVPQTVPVQTRGALASTRRPTPRSRQ